jgi:D-glycero-beta-D-manno-heptose-7-phosphate kinase
MASFNQFRILVLGDLILDHYVFGDVNRVSPEAPVPVVEHRWEEKRLGGAGNVAANIYGLCGRVMISGVLGIDAPGALFTSMLMGMTDFYGGIIECKDRRTTHKMRVLGNRQQLLRLDQEVLTPIDRTTTESILSFVRWHHGKIDAIVVSDYAKGVVTQQLMDGLRGILDDHERKIPLIIDPKRDDPGLYRGAKLLTPNLKEASALANMAIKNADDLEEAGERIVDATGCELLLITQGPGGMTLFDGLHEPISVPTEARHVYDVSGAGDTVTACMTLGLLSNMGAKLSAAFANMAAGMVVGEIGTTTVDPKKIRESLELVRDGNRDVNHNV